MLTIINMQRENEHISSELDELLVRHTLKIKESVNDLKKEDKLHEPKSQSDEISKSNKSVERMISRISAQNMQIKDGDKKHWKFRHLLDSAKQIEELNLFKNENINQTNLESKRIER